MSIGRDEATMIACRFAATGPINEAAIVAWHDDSNNYWVVTPQPGGEEIRVDSQSGQPRWARITSAEWRVATNPRAMLLAIRRIVDASLYWQFICVLGRQEWDRLDCEQDQIAIRTTERWLAGLESEDELSFVWFCAIGSGAKKESGWGIADEWLDSRSTGVFPPIETCDVIREVFGNPFNSC